MIGDAIAKQIPFRYVLNDIWFSSAENMVFIKAKKKDFIMPLKSNRKVALSESAKKQGQWMPIHSVTLTRISDNDLLGECSFRSAVASSSLHKRRWLHGYSVSGDE